MNETLDIFCNFFKNYCKLDMKKLGCVSISCSKKFDIDGIKKYYNLLEKWGIDKKNIYIRDTQKAIKQGKGDGYWIYPGFNNLRGWTISFHYQLKPNSNISTYQNYNNWIEIAEIGENLGAVGLERINFVIKL